MKLGLLTTALVLAPLFLGCSDAAPDETVATDEAALRYFVPGELVGSIACGETKRLHHPGSPTYRAFSFDAQRYQTYDVLVSAPGHDPRAWITTASNSTVASNDDQIDSLDARIVYQARSTTQHHVVFREKSSAPADFTITMKCPGVTPPPPPPPPSEDPFDPSSCTGERITQAQASEKLLGRAFAVIGGSKKLRARKRGCDAAGVCGAWNDPADATRSFYMAYGSGNSNVERPFDVALSFATYGSAIHAVVHDLSYQSGCLGCRPAGVRMSLLDGLLQGSDGSSTLFLYVPRWVHTSDGFVIHKELESVTLGTHAATSFTVTNTCARLSVLSSNKETEYAVLYRY